MYKKIYIILNSIHYVNIKKFYLLFLTYYIYTFINLIKSLINMTFVLKLNPNSFRCCVGDIPSNKVSI